MEPEEIPNEEIVDNYGTAEDDDFDDDQPDLTDAVEVEVDEENVPMDEDDDEEVDTEEQAARQIVDMSKVQLLSHTGPVYAVACHIDASTQTLSILTGGGDDKAFLHRVLPSETSSSTHSLDYQHKDSVSAVALNIPYVSEDLKKTPRLAAVGAYDGAIVIYDPDSGNQLKTLEGPSDVECLSFHPKGGSVLLAGSAADGTIWMFHIPMNKCLQVFVGHESGVTAGAFSPDGRWALSASSDGTVRIWAPRTGVSKHVFRLGEAGLTCMETNGGSDGQLIIVGGEDGQAHVCHIGSKKVLASLRHFEPPNSMAEDEEVDLPMSVEAVGFAPASVNQNWCATGGVDGVLKIWDLSKKGGQCRQICRPPREAEPSKEDNDGTNADNNEHATGGITRLKWHPSLPYVLTSCCDGTIRLWDARNGQQLHSLTGHGDVINDMDVQFSSDGNTALIVSASDDKSVRIFELNVASLTS